VNGAIRTDFILSAEIMAITLAAIPPGSFVMQAAVLATVGLGITVGVYGVVALIVKADDVGLALAGSNQPVSSLMGLRNAGPGEPSGADRALAWLTRPLGRGLVIAMPWFLNALSVLGVIAMTWVGGGILLHGLHEFGFHQAGHLIEAAAHAAGAALPGIAAATGWTVTAVSAAVFGILAGGLLIPLVHVLAPVVRSIGSAFRPARSPS
jgi:predicted DNA repair protein MutK